MKKKEPLVETECGVCGKELKVPMNKINFMGFGICGKCQKIVDKESDEMQKYGIKSNHVGGGLLIIRG